MIDDIKKKINANIVYLVPYYDRDILQLDDTIESIVCYTKEPYSIVCLNDCKDEINKRAIYENKRIINFMPNIGDSAWPRNTYGSLFCKKYQAMEFILRSFDFEYIVCMDTDALITGFQFYDYLNEYFKNSDNKNVGVVGSYKIRADGKKRTRWQWGLYMLHLAYIKGSIPRKSFFWSELLPQAKKHGYKLGEHFLGGAFVISYRFIQHIMEIYPYEMIQKDKIHFFDIGDDVIFSLLAFTSNLTIGDFGRPSDPMAIAQKYLPIPKEDIITKNKQIIHSVKRGLHGESEGELRSFFRMIRAETRREVKNLRSSNL